MRAVLSNSSFSESLETQAKSPIHKLVLTHVHVDHNLADQVFKDWEKHKTQILDDFIEKNPGRRPFCWWKFSAPRWSRPYWADLFPGEFPEPRQRVGGIGTEIYEVLNIKPRFYFGIPIDFVDQWTADFYNGRLEHLKKDTFLKYDYKEGHFAGIGLDVNDPPQYEAEATYLKRHSLLLKSEEKRLRKADFEPVSVLDFM